MPRCQNWLASAIAVPALLCAASTPAAPARQTPINIRPAQSVPLRHAAPIRATLADDVTLDLANTWAADGPIDAEWATLKATVPAGSTLTLGPVRYNLLQFHFHTPAEHAINGRRAPMEVHFVFLRDGSQPCGRNPDALLVIGAMIRPGPRHAELGKIFDAAALPANAAAGHLAVPHFNLGKVLGPLHPTWRYPGSLTAPASFAPACTQPEGDVAAQLAARVLPENVSWVVLQRPITMSAGQIAAFVRLFPHGNSRPLQPVGSRRVGRAR